MPAPVLFCADPLRPRSVDGHFAADAAALRAAGSTVALLDNDTLLRGYPGAAVRAVPRDLGPNGSYRVGVVSDSGPIAASG